MTDLRSLFCTYHDMTRCLKAKESAASIDGFCLNLVLQIGWLLHIHFSAQASPVTVADATAWRNEGLVPQKSEGAPSVAARDCGLAA